MYFIGLIWSFIGVAIVADIFMCAIEVITSKVSHITVAKQDGTSEVMEVRFWNDTVANLTLMAMGSSMPEIFLNIIEICGNNFEAGVLGPGTIVGSAAFNLLVIIGVCIAGIPEGETRRIDRFYVYGITAAASVGAYIWLLIILKVSTEGVVDLWEAIVTFLFFPVMVIMAYMADRNLLCFQRKPEVDKEGQVLNYNPDTAEGIELIGAKQAKGDVALVQQFMRSIENPHDIDESTAAAALATKLQGPREGRSRAWYRVNATRMLTAGRQIEPNAKVQKMARSMSNINNKIKPENSVFNFACTSSSVLESGKEIELVVVRSGNLDCRSSVRYETIDGTANRDEDYKHVQGVLVFEPSDTKKGITIEIIDDDDWEPDETFFCKLLCDTDDPTSKLGSRTINQVTIVNDDDPGTFEFNEPSFIVKESQGFAELPVKRSNGCDGKVEVEWYTVEMSAKRGQDFVEDQGIVCFENGEQEKMVRIQIVQSPDKEPDETFRVVLGAVSEGAQLGHTKETIVTIIGDAEFQNMVNRVVAKTHIALGKMELGHESWSEQFVQAMNVNGGEVEDATGFDYVMHFLTFGFKTIFAIIPPPSIGGGWPCFVGALIFIAIFTTIIADLANIFGCLIMLKPSVNAITLVAMGTSLPDLFASKTAAVQERHADNSIGNVTGSNSVNVFLGLGLPWSIAAIYHAVKGTPFLVPPGTLAFSVTLYSVCSVICLIFLLVRRLLPIFDNAELGGSNKQKYASAAFLMGLWVVYVLCSALQAYEIIPGF